MNQIMDDYQPKSGRLSKTENRDSWIGLLHFSVERKNSLAISAVFLWIVLRSTPFPSTQRRGRSPPEISQTSAWDSPWRLRLVDNLEILTKQLWQVGVREVYADGSFAEDKDHPNDIDGYFVCGLNELASGDLA
jgi:hypothetical protein